MSLSVEAMSQPRTDARVCVAGRPVSAAMRLFAEIRNAEAAIQGFCQLAGEGVISPREALEHVEQALEILGRARRLAETEAGRPPDA